MLHPLVCACCAPTCAGPPGPVHSRVGGSDNDGGTGVPAHAIAAQLLAVAIGEVAVDTLDLIAAACTCTYTVYGPGVHT